MDELTRITVDEQTETQRREARKFVAAIAGDVCAYHAALKDAGIDGELLDTLTRDFGQRWHAYQLSEDVEIDLTTLYAEGDE